MFLNTISTNVPCHPTSQQTPRQLAEYHTQSNSVHMLNHSSHLSKKATFSHAHLISLCLCFRHPFHPNQTQITLKSDDIRSKNNFSRTKINSNRTRTYDLCHESQPQSPTARTTVPVVTRPIRGDWDVVTAARLPAAPWSLVWFRMRYWGV